MLWFGWRRVEWRRLRRRRHPDAGSEEHERHHAIGNRGSSAKQFKPTNVAAGSGAGEQSNTNRSGDASAWNKNQTGQSNGQFQKGVGGNATSGDATVGGSCCKPDGHPKPRPKPGYGSHKGHGKSKSDKPCQKYEPKPHKPEHGGDATSGEAKGGDVDQGQRALNDNGTTQTAEAASIATQKKPLNVLVGQYAVARLRKEEEAIGTR